MDAHVDVLDAYTGLRFHRLLDAQHPAFEPDAASVATPPNNTLLLTMDDWSADDAVLLANVDFFDTDVRVRLITAVLSVNAMAKSGVDA